MRALWCVGISMTPKNFVSGLLEHRLNEAQPQTVKVGATYQGSFSPSSRVPFIRLAGHWLADAGFSKGDELQVSVALARFAFGGKNVHATTRTVKVSLRRHRSNRVKANAFAVRAGMRGLARHFPGEFLHVAAGITSPCERPDLLE